MSVPGTTQPIEDAPEGDAPHESPADGDLADTAAAIQAEAGKDDAGEDDAGEDDAARADIPATGEDAADEYWDYEEYDENYAETGERPRLSALAVVTLVCGLLALVPVALILGVLALTSIGRNGKRGRRMAVAGIYAAWIWLLIGAAVAVLAYFTHGFRPHEQVQYRSAAAYSLRAGECLNGDPNVTMFTTVPCAARHQFEVYGRIDLSGGAYPGAVQIRQQAIQECQVQLTSYANPQLVGAGFSQEYVYPDQPAWSAGERTVICMARFPSGIAGSIRK
jgi:hypothetical protein